MTKIIKLLEVFQINQEKVKQIEEVAHWLSATLPHTVKINSRKIALSGGKE